MASVIAIIRASEYEVIEIIQYAAELVETLETDEFRQELKIRSVLAYSKLRAALDKLKEGQVVTNVTLRKGGTTNAEQTSSTPT